MAQFDRARAKWDESQAKARFKDTLWAVNVFVIQLSQPH